MNKIGFISIAAGVVAAAAIPNLAAAQETPWSVRIGITDLQPANKSDVITGFPSLGADAVEVDRKVLPEIDVFYTFTPNIVAELVLSYPQTMNVNLKGVGNLGTFKALPPTLLGQWHFLPGQQFDPYVGAGVNFTWIQPVHIDAYPGLPLDLKKSSFGAAIQAGVDYNVDKRWFVNADIKYIAPLQTDLLLKGSKVSVVKVDPILYSLGVGYHF